MHFQKSLVFNQQAIINQEHFMFNLDRAILQGLWDDPASQAKTASLSIQSCKDPCSLVN